MPSKNQEISHLEASDAQQRSHFRWLCSQWTSLTFSHPMQRNSKTQQRFIFSFVCSDIGCKTPPRRSTVVEREIPLEIDAGFLTVTDPNPVDEESYQ